MHHDLPLVPGVDVPGSTQAVDQIAEASALIACHGLGAVSDARLLDLAGSVQALTRRTASELMARGLGQ